MVALRTHLLKPCTVSVLLISMAALSFNPCDASRSVKHSRSSGGNPWRETIPMPGKKFSALGLFVTSVNPPTDSSPTTLNSPFPWQSPAPPLPFTGNPPPTSDLPPPPPAGSSPTASPASTSPGIVSGPRSPAVYAPPTPQTAFPSPPQTGFSPPWSPPPFPAQSPPAFVPGPPLFLPPVVFPAPPGPPPPVAEAAMVLWCVAKPSVPDPIIQEAMDYACGSGADCDTIQRGGACFAPDTVIAHASFAFNSYWQRSRVGGGTCEFGGTAMLVSVDPSHGDCKFVNA